MKRIVLSALLLAAPMLAQTAPNERITKLVALQNVDPHEIEGMVRMFDVNSTANSQMKSMVIYGFPEKVAAAEVAIKQLDVAPKNIDLTVYFVVGGDQANLEGGAVPQEIRDVITQLKGTFTFKEYKMLDVLTLRTRAGSGADTSGILNTGNPPKMSKFSIRNATVSGDGTTIRIDRMNAGLKIPVVLPAGKGVEYTDSGILQDVDVKEGQKVVVGRSSLAGPQQALFLILTAHVIQ
jgi:hypothetical protein